jgi:pSer/pThr/pTyr-binding forkhead associated (FHA) protein
VQSGRRGGERLKLKPGRETNVWEIGSDARHDIVLEDAGVSGYHAKLVNEGNRWKLIDQMSANGSFVNGQKSNISYLKHGDRLRFGPVECVFQLPDSQGGGAAKASTPMSPWMIGAIAFAITAGAIMGAYLIFS